MQIHVIQSGAMGGGGAGANGAPGLGQLFSRLIGGLSSGGGLASNPGNYVNSQEALEALMTQLLQAGGSTGAPPTEESVIKALQKVEITDENVSDFSEFDCAVCKDSFEVGGDALHKLPCEHYFHCDCIIPWLKQHNTCPVCRSALT